MNNIKVMAVHGNELDQDEVNAFLDGLRATGAANMFGAGQYVEEAFGVSKARARTAVVEWMRTFSERHRAGPDAT